MSTIDEPDPMANAPFAGTPVEDLTPRQLFTRLAWERATLDAIRARVRAYAAHLLATHGVDGANDRLPADVSIDSLGTVRFHGDLERDSILAELPPGTTFDPATRIVTIDDDLDD